MLPSPSKGTVAHAIMTDKTLMRSTSGLQAWLQRGSRPGGAQSGQPVRHRSPVRSGGYEHTPPYPDGELPTTAEVPMHRLGSIEGRLGPGAPCWYEDAGTIIEAGPDLQHLVGRKVAM